MGGVEGQGGVGRGYGGVEMDFRAGCGEEVEGGSRFWYWTGRGDVGVRRMHGGYGRRRMEVDRTNSVDSWIC